MDKYSIFDKEIEKAAERFKSWDKKQPVRLISHLDADGISSSAILTNLLNLENRKHSISIMTQLTHDDLVEFSKEDCKYFIFADLGSGKAKDIASILSNKEVIILDHHEIEKDEAAENIAHINPHLSGIDGSKEISGAGVAYLFAEKVNKKTEALAHLAIIGAIGDIQEDEGFLPLNAAILKKAIDNNKLRIKKSLKVFGIQTRPIHKILEYSSELNIPGVSGSESGAVQFLQQLGIDPKKGNDWKKVSDLTDEEMKKLIAGIIIKRFGEANPEDIIGDSYILRGEEDNSPTRDAREFATLLNACGRMERASCGIGLCLGIEKDKKMALQTLADYKKEIVNAMCWFEDNKKSKSIIEDDEYLIINAENNIPHTIIGTLASIISKSKLSGSKYIMSLARSKNNQTKISLRTLNRSEETDLREIIKKIVDKTGGEAGGHMQAAGALIPTEKEEEFIELAKGILSNTKK